MAGQDLFWFKRLDWIEAGNQQPARSRNGNPIASSKQAAPFEPTFSRQLARFMSLV